MWEVPQTSLEAREVPDLARELLVRHGLAVVPGPQLARVRHTVTFRRIRVEIYRGRLRREVPCDPDRYRWVLPRELPSLPVSSLTGKIMRGVCSPQIPLALEAGSGR
jgi:hypothetical protein